MQTIELERTYLAKYLPHNLQQLKSKDMLDLYIPRNEPHPILRIRKNGDKYEITKKSPAGDDKSHMIEQTINLTADEFNTLAKVDGKKIHKIRYLMPYGTLTAEIDVFQEDLSGLVLVDFEFSTVKEKEQFTQPDFCLVEVTQETFIAGGMLCGKSYKDIEDELIKYKYARL